MTYDTYRLIFIVGAGACAVMLIVSVILFFVLKIPKVIGDLSGRNARRGIEDIQKRNGQSDVGMYRQDRIKNRGNTNGFGTRTEKIATQKMVTARLDQADETTVLYTPTAGETTVLSDATQMPFCQVVKEIILIHTEEVI